MLGCLFVFYLSVTLCTYGVRSGSVLIPTGRLVRHRVKVQTGRVAYRIVRPIGKGRAFRVRTQSKMLILGKDDAMTVYCTFRACLGRTYRTVGA